MTPGHPTIPCEKDVSKYFSHIGKKVYCGQILEYKLGIFQMFSLQFPEN